MPGTSGLPVTGSTRRVLELDRVLERIAGFAQTPMGGDRVRSMRPVLDLEELSGRHARIDEIRRYAQRRGFAALGPATPIDATLARVATRGVVLEAAELQEVARLARVADELRRYLPGQAEEWPSLATAREGIADLQALTRQIDGLFGADGEIRDDASPALQRIRRQTRRLRTEVRSRLERMTKQEGVRDALGEALVTERAGRLVIPVRSGQRDRVQGIVHDTSSSGQTLFVEPSEMVGDQNRIAELAGEEREEIRRLLAEATAHVRAAADALRGAQRIIGRVDRRQAIARWAADAGAIVPEWVEAGVRLRQARHPLIARESFVPLDLEIDPGVAGVVITGPNTGGKTVALKTLGLMSLLGQSGIPVPAAEARLPVFTRIHADIGDEQSIDASLSTFSAHMRNIVGFLADAPPGTLVLLDELGTGTDPEEGAALGVALLQRLMDLGATVFASTHHDAIKSFAHADARAVNAAMEFDPESLAPTYRIRIGRPGRSNALEIAAGLGLDPEIITAARGLLRAETVRLDEVIRRLEQENREAESERLDLERRRVELDRELERHAEAERRRNEQTAAAEHEARAAVREVIAELKRQAAERLERLEAETSAPASSERSQADRRARWSAAIGSLESDALRALRDRLDEAAPEPPADRPERPRRRKRSDGPPAGRPAEDAGRDAEVDVEGTLPRGTDVTVAPFGLEGVVLQDWSPDDDKPVEVDVGGKRLLVRRDQLTRSTGRRRRRRSGVDTSFRTRRDVLPEVDLHGMTVERALEVVDRYLDDAILAGYPSVRLIHGYGTLRLRDAIRKWLAGRPGVAGYGAADASAGGAGVTVVRLSS